MSFLLYLPSIQFKISFRFLIKLIFIYLHPKQLLSLLLFHVRSLFTPSLFQLCSLYNIQLQILSTFPYFTVIDFHVQSRYLSSDHLHLRNTFRMSFRLILRTLLNVAIDVNMNALLPSDQHIYYLQRFHRPTTLNYAFGSTMLSPSK